MNHQVCSQAAGVFVKIFSPTDPIWIHLTMSPPRKDEEELHVAISAWAFHWGWAGYDLDIWGFP